MMEFIIYIGSASFILYSSALLFLEKHAGDFLRRFPKSGTQPAFCRHKGAQAVSEVNAADINQHIAQSPAPCKKQLQEFREKGKQAAQNDGFGIAVDGFGQDQEQDAERQGMAGFLEHIDFAVQMNIAGDEQIR